MDNERIGIEIVADTSKVDEAIDRVQSRLDELGETDISTPFDKYAKLLEERAKAITNNSQYNAKGGQYVQGKINDLVKNTTKGFSTEDLSSLGENIYNRTQDLYGQVKSYKEGFKATNGVDAKQAERFTELYDEAIGKAREFERIQEGITEAFKAQNANEQLANLKENEKLIAKRNQAEAQKNVTDETKKTEKASNAFSKKLKDGVKQIGRMALALVGVRAIFSAIRRVAGENEKLSNATTGMWKVLGASLEPVFNRIADLITRITSAIAKIMSSIVGFNVMDKAFKNSAKNAKSINKSLAGFDELNNIGSNGGGGAGWINQYKQAQFELPEWLIKIADIIKKLAKGIKDTYNAYIKPFVDMFFDTFKDATVSIFESLEALAPVIGIVVTAIADLTLIITSIATKIAEFGAKLVKAVVDFFTGILDNIAPNWREQLENFKNAFNDKIVQPIKNFISGINIDEKLKSMVESAKKVADYIQQWINKLKGFFSTDIKSSNASGLQKALSENSGIRQFATGTNFVPKNQLAYIHQGEAIVPKAFNAQHFDNTVATNELLGELISVVSNMNLKPVVSVKDIADNYDNYHSQKVRLIG